MQSGEIPRENTTAVTNTDQNFPLQNADEPNLFRQMFPYSELPKVLFEDRGVAMAPADRMWITDTTFRDGQQARPPYTKRQVIDLYRLMGKLSGPNRVIAYTEFFVYSDSDIAALEACVEEYASNPSYPEPTCWISGLTDDALYLKLMQHMGIRETGILTSCSDYHVFLKLRKNWKTAAEE